jgi:osmoprotectant transport system substrate-binding protein
MKTRMRFPGRILGAMLIGLTLVAATAGSGSAHPAGGGGKGALTIGSMNFAGDQVLGQVYGQVLAKKGWKVSYRENIGTRDVVFGALGFGDVDLYAEYLNSLVRSLGGSGGPDVDAVNSELQSLLQGRGVVSTTPAPAVDVNGFYVLKKTAKKYKLQNLSDLTAQAGKLTLGAPPDCVDQPLCLGEASQQLYGLQFKEVKALDAGGPETVEALEDGDVQVAVLFTGSSAIPKNAVLLRDDKILQGADHPVVVVRADKSTPELEAAINAVSAKLSTREYRRMTLAVADDQDQAEETAKDFIRDNKL